VRNAPLWRSAETNFLLVLKKPHDCLYFSLPSAGKQKYKKQTHFSVEYEFVFGFYLFDGETENFFGTKR
jgi:hypothetical protein